MAQIDSAIYKQQLLQSILDTLPSLNMGKDAYSFIEEYYQRIPYQDLRLRSSSEWAVIGAYLLEQARYRKLGETILKFKVVDSSSSIKTLAITIINDDQPFLVDSMSEVLKAQGVEVDYLLHPVLKVCRTKEGLFETALPLKPKTANEGDLCFFESMIYCEIRGDLSTEKIDSLKKDLTAALNEVGQAVGDWFAMKSILEGVIVELQESSLPPAMQNKLSETIEFLKWLQSHHFIFLGYCAYDFEGPLGGKGEVPAQHQNELGILKNPELCAFETLFQGVKLNQENLRYILKPELLLLNNTSPLCKVHRSVPMDTIGIKRFNSAGQVVGLHQFVGLFTSRAYGASVRGIPIVREKISKTILSLGLRPDWHDGKVVLQILESLPTDELLQANTQYLYSVCQGILQLHKPAAIFAREDRFRRFLSCLVFIERERYEASLDERIGNSLAQELGGRVISNQSQLGELPYARIHYTISLPKIGSSMPDVTLIEEKLLQLTETWQDNLNKKLEVLTSQGHLPENNLDNLDKAFSRSYQDNFSVSEAVEDILAFNTMFAAKKEWSLRFRMEEGKEKSLFLKIYKTNEAVPLGHILPILENAGITIIREMPFVVRPDSGPQIWIQDFEITLKHSINFNLGRAQYLLSECLEKVWSKEIESDLLHRLILSAGLTSTQIAILRAYTQYLRQLQVTFSQETIKETLARYPHISSTIVKLFEAKTESNDPTSTTFLHGELLKDLDKIINPDEDRILRRMINLILATVRTANIKGENPKDSFFAFKFDCRLIEDIPLPRPLYEIFLYSPRFEAVHLRGGKVARGGIRWSDRREDFRTEILGLMKAQMVKNSVIVPVGAKGGFVLKYGSLLEGETLRQEAVECYHLMMKGLLRLTDNVKNGSTVPPLNIVCHDEEDPYLVVAADKGTATFSDYANQVSINHGFWLGDAFASGGSAGYDHKKIAITARGAWESVKHHFYELGTDISTTPISIVGVGDMSGDVFGNGLLMSSNVRLVAAFNHQHIFIDPNPDCESSFKERKRLFNLPRSQWADYDPNLLSPGGRVFERSSKLLKLTPEIQALLGEEIENTTPNELIQKLLRLPVDLLWFGGIGTFIKSRYESNSDVGDRANDNCRIDGREVRAKVIAEGANLGMTQRARIEYAAQGGRLNCDAIDNSAGVDCSDHEVNIKILLNPLVTNNHLSLEERNELLKAMENEVAHLVLHDNISQNLAISLAELQGSIILDPLTRLIKSLEKGGKLDRNLEDLPDESTLQERLKNRQGLLRPELAIVLAYSKISLYQELIDADIINADYLLKDLYSYFPKALQEKFPAEIRQHPLHREIIATSLTNEFINRFGPHFVYDVADRAGRSQLDVVKAYLIVREIFGLDAIWQEIENLKYTIKGDVYLQLIIDLTRMLKRSIYWFLRYHSSLDISKLTEVYHFKQVEPEFPTPVAFLRAVLDPTSLAAMDEKILAYEAQGVYPSLAQKVASIRWLITLPEMLRLSHELNQPISEVAHLYCMIGQRFGYNWLRDHAERLSPLNPLHKLALSGLIEDLFILQSELCARVVRNEGGFEKWKEAKTNSIERLQTQLTTVQASGIPDFALLTLVTRELRMMVV